MNRLSAAKVKGLNTIGKYPDGGGLTLWIKPALAKGVVIDNEVTKSWILRYWLNNAEHNMGLGSLQDVGLGLARELRDDARKLLARGIDPIEARRTERMKARADALRRRSFKECLDEFINSHSDGWRTKHDTQYRNSMATYCKPIMAVSVADVDIGMVLLCIEKDWKRVPTTMDRVRSRIEDVLGYAQVRDYRPAGVLPTQWKDHLDKILPHPQDIKPTKHHPSLPYVEAPALYQKLVAPGAPIHDLCLAFTMLTVGRSVEQREAQRSEFNGNRLWVVPPSRMKRKRPHNVPLSSEALAIIERLPNNGPYLFVMNGNAKPIVAQTLRNRLKRHAGKGFTVHGMRSMFRGWADEQTDAEKDMKEISLAHKIGNRTEEAYSRSALIEKRRELLQEWADYLTGKIGLARVPDQQPAVLSEKEEETAQ